MGIEAADDGRKRAVREGEKKQYKNKEPLLRSCFVSCGLSFDRGFGFLLLTEMHTVDFWFYIPTSSLTTANLKEKFFVQEIH